MATCYEKLGQLASAWGHYREVVVLASKAGDAARVQIARDRIAALEPRLPKLTIKPPKTKIAGLAVSRDDAPLDPAALGVSFYVDPGEHSITASAPGRIPSTQHIVIEEKQSKELAIPELALAPHAKDQPGTTTTIVREDIDPGRGRRVFALTIGGAGIVAAITGVGFGVAARASWNSAFDDKLCDKATNTCSQAGQERTDTARTRALLANVIGGAGVAFLAVGVVLYVTAPERPSGGPHVEIAPTSGGAAVSIGGSW
jgi:hypothetical protein